MQYMIPLYGAKYYVHGVLEVQMVDQRFVEKRKYDIKQLWAKHHEITRQVVLGRTNVEIAEVVGCTPQTVSNVRNSPLAQERIAELGVARDANAVSISQRIEEFAPIALQVLEDIITGQMDGASVALRARAASGHLARAGYGEVQKVHALHAHVNSDDISRIKQRALNAARECGMVIEG